MGHLRSATECEPLAKRLGSTMQKQRREFDKRLPDVLSVYIRRMVGTGPQSSPQIHPPTHTQGARQPGWGERRGPREHPGERVGARGRGRGRARGWHTRVTAQHRQGGQRYRQVRQREGEWEGRQAREGAQGSGTRVAQRRTGGTRRARRSSKEREQGKKNKNNSRTGGHTGGAQRGGRAREVGGTGGQRGRKGTQCLTENHHADHPHRAVPAAPPDHQGTDGGAAGGRGRRGSPPEGVYGEAAQVGLQVRRQGRGPEAREGTRDATMARRGPAASIRCRRTTLRGRAGDRGEGRVERRESRYMYINAG